ncbi:MULTISPECIES: DUF456 family protein [Streptomyces]|uniref:DUF456 domain-containing protein n=2 Tax=Streptomyces cacaoi TaxID=1898 RepID=A0A4Y3R6M5_STRCI|nr:MULTISPECIES: DUF456 family protein [Streptomyces]NNG84736.1 DUF456 family protein [Streptomyces cacaoi]QHF96298.1 DUF456 domain-containing protein [Streptomyces sp. NHF165]GEB53242.1 hypothetical protein SCA03_57930 [Streptomyces cacaoi]
MTTSGQLNQVLLVGLVLAMGLVGVVLPGVPGPLVVWAAVFWWAAWTATLPAWWLLTAVTGLLLTTAAARLLVPVRPEWMQDVGRRTLLAGGAGGAVGFVVLPVVGVVPGFVAGVYVRERLRLGGHGSAAAATRTAMRATGWRTLTDLTACLLTVAGWLGTVLWR